MGNSAYKKEQAIKFNENRALKIKREAEVKQDKIDNPEKYASKSRTSRKAQAFMAAALAINPNAFDVRHNSSNCFANKGDSEENLEADLALAKAVPELLVGGKYNFKDQPERLVYLGNNFSGNGYWHQFAKVEEPVVVWSEMQDSDLTLLEVTKEEPVLIKTWEELSKVEGDGNFRLDITPEDGNGWIRKVNPEEDSFSEYLSTHTFYGKTHEYSTKLLQAHGFNVTIANWDDN